MTRAEWVAIYGEEHRQRMWNQYWQMKGWLAPPMPEEYVPFHIVKEPTTIFRHLDALESLETAGAVFSDILYAAHHDRVRDQHDRWR